VKRAVALIGLALLGTSFSHSSDPFDRYIASVKAGRPLPSVRSIADECGVSIEKSRPRYALNNGTWRISKNLTKDVYDAATDYLSTAELWTGTNGSKVLNLWSVDLGQDVSVLYCLDSNGRIRLIDSVQWAFREEGTHTVDWIYKQYRRFSPDGKLVEKTGHFEDNYGKPIPSPKLDADQAKNYDWLPSGTTLKEMDLPKEWQK